MLSHFLPPSTYLIDVLMHSSFSVNKLDYAYVSLFVLTTTRIVYVSVVIAMSIVVLVFISS